MTIKIRSLKRSAAGRENIRERTIEGQEITIGRASSCDVELSALTISLNHALVKQGTDGKARFILLHDSQALVNGRMISARSIDLKPGDHIRLGPYALTIEIPDHADEFILTIEQVDAEDIAVSGKDETAVFNLRGTLPGKRLMAWAFTLAIAGFFILLPVWAHYYPDGKLAGSSPVQTDLAWNSGPISLQHSNLKSDCKTCHVDAFKTVADATCIDCHKSTSDHALAEDMRRVEPTPTDFGAGLNSISEKFGRPVNRCSSCHVEHNTRAHLTPIEQTLCSDCHSDMDMALPDTRLRNVSDFGSDHPQFKPTITVVPDFNSPTKERVSLDDNPKSNSGLKFPHKLHLESGGGVARMARNLGDRYGFSDGVDCADCHRPEAGGALFESVSMQQDCAMCHSLAFEDDEGYMRTLRHGEPGEVTASMRDFYLAKALGNIRDAEMNSETRRRPGRAAALRDLNRREIAFKQADERTAVKVESIFSEGGACFDCHQIERPADPASLKFKVKPIYVDDAFYPMARFNHKSHEASAPYCATCHTAESSSASSDVLLPTIDVCRDCHIGEESYKQGGKLAQGTFPTTCLTCHVYHGDGHSNAANLQPGYTHIDTGSDQEE